MSPNPVCWNLLARKAQTTVNARQQSLSQAKQHLQQLQASQQRMQQMFEEYRQQELSEAARHWDAQARLNHRQFMAQLLRVQEKLQRELGLASRAVDQASQALIQAQLQLQKMNSLDAQQAQKTQVLAEQREQLKLDELAMMRFNLGTNA